ncbi:hypothetical protein GCM10009557_73860 [Virgisporangium ochraceum]|uniref:Uncharacterized protein n=1 Tax=Virgisporangium ochraceum TaxID=65505 RepID=A0A8J4EE59_9ACTN|nr:hypothetical protein [Virgisporangium ochraceum]GIJ72265.1 hypothetical protein Voc01_071820 [Virgisporangium ochraceum]
MTEPEPEPRPEPPGDTAQWRPRRRTVVIGLAALVVVALAVVGVTVVVVQREPDTPTEVVTAFLEAARDGDAGAAATWWMDLEGTRGGAGLRDRIRDYVERWHSRYEEALDDREWTLTEGEARLGRSVRVSVGGREADYLVGGTDEGPRIALGPEDQFGQSAGGANPLFVGG